MGRYGWGIDGFGRAHIDKDGDCIVRFCMLHGQSGFSGASMLEDQDKADDSFTLEINRQLCLFGDFFPNASLSRGPSGPSAANDS